MQIVYKYLFIAILAMLPAIAAASVDSPSFSCSSTFVVSFDNGYQASCDGDFTFDQGALLNDKSISITANGLLNVGKQAIFTAPNTLLTPKNIVIDGRLNALGGSVELQGSETVALNSTAIIDLTGHVLPKPVNIIDYWSGQVVELPRGSKITLLPRVITTSNFNTFASGNLMLVGSGIRQQNVESMQLGGEIVLLGYISGSAIQQSEAGISSGSFVVSQVPEPSSLSLLAMGLFCVVMVVRRKSKRS